MRGLRATESMVNFLQSLRIKFRDPDATEDVYPFNIPVVQSLDTILFRSPVTFFVGENGSGKSTILEAIAASAGSITIGGESIKTDPTLNDARRLAAQLTLSWARRTHRGFFMRSEDFFNYALSTRQMIEELDEQAAEYATER